MDGGGTTREFIVKAMHQPALPLGVLCRVCAPSKGPDHRRICFATGWKRSAPLESDDGAIETSYYFAMRNAFACHGHLPT